MKPNDFILITSEKLNLEEDEKQKLLDLIDFNKLSEDALQKAYEADIFPSNHVTKAALALCSKLRSQLDNAKEVIKTQEVELNKFGLGGRGSLWLKANDPGNILGFAVSFLTKKVNSPDIYPQV